MKSNRKFYAELPLLNSFFEASDPTNYHPIPEDWLIAVTDIENSTEAVNNGEYKSVNILGASSIAGLLNSANHAEIPFSFGGDGCAICIPPDLQETTHQVLSRSKQIGRSAYGLHLRAAIIPVSKIREAGFDVKVARFKVSEMYAQAVFRGGGLTFAEDLLKSPVEASYQVNSDEKKELPVNFEGLECRWKEVGAKRKKVITILAKANPAARDAVQVYKDVLNHMAEIFEFDSKTNPINSGELSMHLSVRELMEEVKFRSFGMNTVQRLLYLLKVEMEVLMGKIFMKFGYKSSATDWALYKKDLALNSDHRKFDDMLRLVISGTEEQCNAMRNYLQQQFEASRLAYGMHISDKAIVTCMVFRYHREHIHFVDGSEGGYVQASKTLKKQLNSLG